MSRRPFRLSLLLAAVLITPAAAAETPRHEAEALIRAYLEVWNSGDVTALDDVVSDDFRRGDWNGPVASRAELAERIRQEHRSVAGLELELHDLLIDGERAAARLTRHGTWRATGAVFAVPEQSVFRLRGGRLVAEEPMDDHVAFMEALGYRVVLPGETTVPPPVEGPPPDGPDLEGAAAELEDAAAELSAGAGKRARSVVLHGRSVGRLAVDRRELGVLAPGRSVELRLPPGEHTVALRSLGGLPLDGRRLDIPRRGGGDPVELTLGPAAPLAVHLGDGVTEDLRSGLMWTLRDNGEDVEWQQAKAYCDALQHAGYDDWRLPDVRQLLPLYDPDSEKDWKTLPGIELSSCCPWSRNLHHDDTMAWFFVSYKGGRALRFFPFKRYMRALCVRQPAM